MCQRGTRYPLYATTPGHFVVSVAVSQSHLLANVLSEAKHLILNMSCWNLESENEGIVRATPSKTARNLFVVAHAIHCRAKLLAEV